LLLIAIGICFTRKILIWIQKSQVVFYHSSWSSLSKMRKYPRKLKKQPVTGNTCNNYDEILWDKRYRIRPILDAWTLQRKLVINRLMCHWFYIHPTWNQIDLKAQSKYSTQQHLPSWSSGLVNLCSDNASPMVPDEKAAFKFQSISNQSIIHINAFDLKQIARVCSTMRIFI